jgi:hypothetical protein
VKPAGRRRKGCVGERELAALLDGAIIRGRTLTARRVPNVGAMAAGSWGGDVLMGERCNLTFPDPHPEGCVRCAGTGVEPGSEERVEVKRRAGGKGFALIERWIADSHMLALRADRGEWLIVIRLSDLVETKP